MLFYNFSKCNTTSKDAFCGAPSGTSAKNSTFFSLFDFITDNAVALSVILFTLSVVYGMLMPVIIISVIIMRLILRMNKQNCVE